MAAIIAYILQVCIPGLHIIQEIFQKLLSFYQSACHELNLKLAHLQTGSLNSGPEFDMYLKTIKEVEKTREELEYAKQERDALQQGVTYCSLYLPTLIKIFRAM